MWVWWQSKAWKYGLQPPLRLVNDKKKRGNELFLLFGNPFCFLEPCLTMLMWFRVVNVCWSTDRILQPCVGRTLPCSSERCCSFAGPCMVPGGWYRGAHTVRLRCWQWRHSDQNLQIYVYLHREKDFKIERFGYKICPSKSPLISWESQRRMRQSTLRYSCAVALCLQVWPELGIEV